MNRERLLELRQIIKDLPKSQWNSGNGAPRGKPPCGCALLHSKLHWPRLSNNYAKLFDITDDEVRFLFVNDVMDNLTQAQFIKKLDKFMKEKKG